MRDVLAHRCHHGAMVDCVFCRIVAGSSPALLVFRDDDACAFLDIDPVRPGHVLVIPNRHVTGMTAGGAAEAWADTGRAVAVVARILTRRLPADGLSIFQSNGESAGQTVNHLHLHLVPRTAGDGRLTNWAGDDRARADIESIHRRITAP